MLPDPDREIFAGGIFQAVNIIEVVVIKLIIDRCKSSFNIAKIHYPTGLLSHGALNGNRNLKGMTMKASAFMPFWNIWQPMGSLYTKLFINLHFCFKYPKIRPIY